MRPWNSNIAKATACLLAALGLQAFAAEGKASGRICTNESGVIICEKRDETPRPDGSARAANTTGVPADYVSSSRHAEADGSGSAEFIAAVRVNGRDVAEFAHLRRLGNDVLVSREDLAAWRIAIPAGEAPRVGGGEWVALSQISGITFAFDRDEGVLNISVAANAFIETILQAKQRRYVEAQPSATGAFVNHDFQLLRGAASGFAMTGLVEAGLFGRWGVLTSRMVARRSAAGTSLYRVDTRLTKDFPDRMTTLTLGDTVSSGASWSRRLNYAGVRWAKSFDTRPDFLPLSGPILAGQAAEPSTVDLYVNNVRTYQAHVDAGPFTVRDLPALTGEGEVRMVVTDALGRQQVIMQPFIGAAELLREGVADYAFEAGALRERFGTSGSAYGPYFGSATYRRGLTDRLTWDGHAEVAGASQALSAGVQYGRLRVGIIGGGVAMSHSSKGIGSLVYATFGHRGRHLGFSAAVQAASEHFRPLGIGSEQPADKFVGQVQAGYSLGNRASVQVGYVKQEKWKSLLTASVPQRFSAVNAGVSVRLSGGATLGVMANYAPGVLRRPSAVVSLVIPLGPRTSLVAVNDSQARGMNSSVDFNHQIPVGTGWGYRVRASHDEQTRVDASLSYQNESGHYAVELGQAGANTSVRLSESGSVVFMGGHVARARWLHDSFAMVETPVRSGVRIFANNQEVARTGRRGVAVVPRLVPYTRNTLRLGDDQVPLDMGLDFDEKQVVPFRRSGLLVKFSGQQITGAVLVLVTAEGAPVPLGALVSIGRNVYQVALHGEVFVSDAGFPARVDVRWADGSCHVERVSVPQDELLPKVGPITCVRDAQ